MITKFRQGWSGDGTQTAAWMNGDDARAVARRVKGDVTVERNGDFTNVYQRQQTSAGYYSLGKIDGGNYKVVGSVTGRGTFAFMGDAGPATWAYVPALAFFGKGLGAVPLIEAVGHVENFDGEPCAVAHVDISTTANGKKMKLHFSYFFYLAPGQGSGLSFFHAGYWWNDGGVRTFAVGYSGMYVDENGQQLPFFGVDNGDGNTTFGATLGLPYQLAIYPITVQMGPGRFLMVHRYYRPYYEDTLVDVPACPGVFRSYSQDAGKTWVYTDSGDMFDDFDSVNTLVPSVYPDDAIYALTYNSAVDAINIGCAMLTGRMAFVVCGVPYCVMVGSVPTIKYKVKYGLCDTLSNFILNSTGTLYDGVIAESPAVQTIGIPGGALMFVSDYDDGDWATPATIKFTPDGVSFNTVGTMPFPPYQTGIVTGVDTKTLICPMFDGEHSLYQSKDWGLTWTKRAVLHPSAPAPEPGSSVLQAFGYVAYLRENGAATNQTPATPWATDSRYPAPP